MLAFVEIIGLFLCTAFPTLKGVNLIFLVSTSRRYHIQSDLTIPISLIKYPVHCMVNFFWPKIESFVDTAVVN